MIVKGADIHNSFDHQPEAPRLEPIAEGFRYPGYKYDHAVNAETRRSLSQSGWTAVLRSTIGTIVISLVLAGMPAAAASAAELKVLLNSQ